MISVPQCEADGSYSTTQCWGSTGYCYCANPHDGEEYWETEAPPGQDIMYDCTTYWHTPHQPTCHAGYTQSDDYCFKVYGMAETWSGANATCGFDGGFLAAPKTQNLNDEILNLLQDNDDGHYWIGLVKSDDDRWQWADGTAPVFTAWAPDEPNNYGGREGCGQVRTEGSEWNDVPCGNKYHFVCQTGKGAKSKCQREEEENEWLHVDDDDIMVFCEADGTYSTLQCDYNERCYCAHPRRGTIYRETEHDGWHDYYHQYNCDIYWEDKQEDSSEAPRWRADLRCGEGYSAPGEDVAECDPDGPDPCCSDSQFCGNTHNHCGCTGCIDYRLPEDQREDFDCVEGDGESYRGTLSKTKSGLTCQRWDKHDPHSHYFYNTPLWNPELEDNYCRNPDGEETIWCYTTDPDVRFEECDLPDCGQREIVDCVEGDGETYRGTLATTESGLTCQRWDRHSPHSHYFKNTPLLNPGSGLEDNYCRNPDGEETIWCYTTDPDVRTGYCHLPECGEPPDPISREDDCQVGDGSSYRGTVATTQSGQPCSPWDGSFGMSDQDENYCRNPDGEPGVWCFVDAPEGWELCDVPVCATCQVGDGVSYRGPVSVTNTGKTCQRWDSQTPHTTSVTPANYPSTGLEENYCRNPDGDTGVWCYTTDRDTRWEFCDVPVCGTGSGDVRVSQCAGSTTNIARGHEVTQSSVHAEGAPERAVDGNVNGNYPDSCTHTDMDYQPWWRVDLGASKCVDRVVVTNRKDCCSERLDDFKVYVGDDPNVFGNPSCGDEQSAADMDTITVACGGLTGRYVGIALPDWQYLTLCEVQVFGDDCLTRVTGTELSYRWDLPPLTSSPFPFEVKASSDVHIALSNQNSPMDDMYEIVIGGWSNSRSVIRRQEQGDAVASAATPDILSPSVYRGFLISWSGEGVISIRLETEDYPFLTWTDPNPLPISHVGYSTGYSSTGTFLFCPHQAPKKWREDYRCGQGYPAEDGSPAECDPDGVYPCCSPANWCGHTADHCDCPTCVDYRDTQSDDCKDGNGETYRGTAAHTVTGLECQRWASHSPHAHYHITPFWYPNAGLDENYCRNPTRDPDPWCYTTDPDVRWEFCDVSLCDDGTGSGKGEDEEHCETTTTDGTDGKYNWDLPPLVTSPFPFEVRAKNNVYIALSPTASDDSRMYLILLGGESDTVTAIRRGREGDWDARAHTIDILSPTEHRGFWISWTTNATIAVGRENETAPLLQWSDPNPIPVQHVGYSTGPGVTGDFRFCGYYEAKRWREDARCGANFPAPGATPGECNPKGPHPCCSDLGWCGDTPQYCSCEGCVDYRHPEALERKDCQVGDGSTYRGEVAVTSSGRVCQEWGTWYPHWPWVDPFWYPNSGLDENYCRNPDGQSGVWCYTMDPDKEMELCNVPKCGDDTDKEDGIGVPIQTSQVCEYETMSLQCPGNQRLAIVHAMFGRTGAEPQCEGGYTGGADCRSINAVSVVKDQCEGRQTCTISADHAVFGDPCFGTSKYLEVKYGCEGNDSRRARECLVEASMRKDCGFPGITRDECLLKGCCFDSSIPHTKWCFYKKGGSCCLS
ncbi:apolipoprotein(a)-like [Branchiostoma lanceolatum]|uniref:apolipoprotein(a)-like n=1 Tax=Branchiostoma lanceolatum TaxID=7740 RepID=UPI0034568CCC